MYPWIHAAAKPLRRALLLWLGACLAYFVAFKAGWIETRPALFAALLGVLLVGWTIEAAVATWHLVRRAGDRRRLVGRAFRYAGGAGILLAGMLNWLTSLQGFVVVVEGESGSLPQGLGLYGVDAGPLADLDKIDLTVHVKKLDLQPAAAGTFVPVSHFILARPGDPPRPITLAAGTTVTSRNLQLRQGAFGYCPHVVITRDGETLFDRTVPFITERHGPRGVRFAGSFHVDRADLDVEGTVDLAGLDEQMRGHPKLALRVRRGDEVLGEGELSPGHFAELRDGHRVGFVGLKGWVEIDAATSASRVPMLVGALLLLVGAGLGLARRRRAP